MKLREGLPAGDVETLDRFERKMELPEQLRGQAPGSILLPYQKQIYEAIGAHDVTVIEKSRRIGATWGIGAKAVLTAGAEKPSGGMDVLYIGTDAEMTREFIDCCAMWARAFNRGAGQVEEFLFVEKDENGDNAIKAFRITFASGFEIMGLSSRPRKLRGRQGLFILDEAAFVDQLDEMLKAAFAFLVWGGRVVILSTHNGEMNPFNALVNDIRAGRAPYHLIRITFDDALAGGLYKRVCLTQGKEWSEEVEAEYRAKIYAIYRDGAAQELDVIPAEGSGVWLAGQVIEACLDPAIPVLRWAQPSSFVHLDDHVRQSAAMAWLEAVVWPELDRLDATLMTAFGQDFGRTQDLTVIIPLQIMPDLARRAPFHIELRNIPFREQELILIETVKRLPRLIGGALDNGGNGMYLAERAMQQFGAERIQLVNLSEPWYRENMPRYKAAFEDRAIALAGDADVLGDHRLIVMQNGVARVPAIRTTGADAGKRHGDAAIAGALAYYASLLNVVPIEFRSSGIAHAAEDALGGYAGIGRNGGPVLDDYLGS